MTIAQLFARRACLLTVTLLLTLAVWYSNQYSSYLKAEVVVESKGAGIVTETETETETGNTKQDVNVITTRTADGTIITRTRLRKEDFPKPLPSPFTKRTGKQLPRWGKKPFFMRDANYTGPDVCFVHVGKTAGSTIGCLLGFDYHCGNVRKIQVGMLPKAARHVVHNTVNDCYSEPQNDMPYYSMFAVRDPLSRMQSWFTYERPTFPNDICYKRTKLLFHDCNYTTLNELAERGLSPEENGESDICKDRAWKAIYGLEGFCRHNYYNYKYFINQAPNHTSWMVLRTEHLRDDWNRIEIKLWEDMGSVGQPVVVREDSIPKFNKSKKTDEDKILSDKARKLLCAVLCREIQNYKKILKWSVNMNSDLYEQALVELSATCPKQARNPACPRTHPINARLGGQRSLV